MATHPPGMPRPPQVRVSHSTNTPPPEGAILALPGEVRPEGYYSHFTRDSTEYRDHTGMVRSMAFFNPQEWWVPDDTWTPHPMLIPMAITEPPPALQTLQSAPINHHPKKRKRIHPTELKHNQPEPRP